jgi:hypothetical protein
MKTSYFLSLVVAIFFTVALPSTAQPTKGLGYDSAVNPSIVLKNAMAEARSTGKKVLVIAGGEWCRWCWVLDSFLAKNSDVKASLHQSFVTVKVYIGEDNYNEAFFSKLPPAKGYPYFWIMNKDGRVEHSINTAFLENGPDDYDRERFLRFIREKNTNALRPPP